MFAPLFIGCFLMSWVGQSLQGELLGGDVSAAPRHKPVFSIKPRHAISPLFKGRQLYLEQLSTFFESRGEGGHPRQEFLLHGLGGAGKSQIALKFAEDCEER